MSTIETLEAVPVEVPVAARPSLLSALRVRDFRLVWVGESISVLGDQFYMIALPWLTLQLTGSGLAVATVAALGGIPRAIFMLVGGVFTDRYSPRTVMLISNVLRILLTVFITITVLTHTIQLWMLLITSFLFGLVDAFFFPAQSAILPQIVAKDQLESGNALTQITGTLAQFVGPALAGITIASLTGVANIQALSDSAGVDPTKGVGFALAFDTLTFIVAAGALWLIKGGRAIALSEEQQGKGVRGVLQSIAEGIRIVWNHALLRTLFLASTAINFLFSGTIGVGLPVLVNTHFTEGAAALGFIFSAFGAGSLIGAVLAGALPTPRRIGITALALIAFAGFTLSLFGFVNTVAAACLVGILMGIGIGYVNVMVFSAMQKMIVPEAMGRVMSFLMLASFGLGPVSNMVAGLLVDGYLNTMFIGAGIILIVIAAYFATNREMRDFVQGAPAATVGSAETTA
jgi:MFS family permease